MKNHYFFRCDYKIKRSMLVVGYLFTLAGCATATDTVQEETIVKKEKHRETSAVNVDKASLIDPTTLKLQASTTNRVTHAQYKQINEYQVITKKDYSPFGCILNVALMPIVIVAAPITPSINLSRDFSLWGDQCFGKSETSKELIAHREPVYSGSDVFENQRAPYSGPVSISSIGKNLYTGAFNDGIATISLQELNNANYGKRVSELDVSINLNTLKNTKNYKLTDLVAEFAQQKIATERQKQIEGRNAVIEQCRETCYAIKTNCESKADAELSRTLRGELTYGLSGGRTGMDPLTAFSKPDEIQRMKDSCYSRYAQCETSCEARADLR